LNKLNNYLNFSNFEKNKILYIIKNSKKKYINYLNSILKMEYGVVNNIKKKKKYINYIKKKVLMYYKNEIKIDNIKSAGFVKKQNFLKLPENSDFENSYVLTKVKNKLKNLKTNKIKEIVKKNEIYKDLDLNDHNLNSLQNSDDLLDEEWSEDEELLTNNVYDFDYNTNMIKFENDIEKITEPSQELLVINQSFLKRIS
jgi:hypothetical protein